MPFILYHHSDPRVRDSILQFGLKTKFDRSGMNAIFLTDKKEGPLDVWEVNVNGLSLEQDHTTEEEGCWMCFDDIPPSKIKLL